MLSGCLVVWLSSSQGMRTTLALPKLLTGRFVYNAFLVLCLLLTMSS
jgi:hypothetical protein